jgi:K+-transporting ATPase c subunit
MKSLRANLLLLVFTVVICCVLYPAFLLAVGRGLFPDAASGSLQMTKVQDGPAVAVGSRLIAQPFTGDGYFWPRPSAAGHNATASGGSNWGANNPKLRDRVARQLGPIVKYKAGSPSAAAGRTPQQDIEAWAAARGEKGEPGADVRAAFFDAWLSDPANAAKAADLQPAAADMVTASGSGLDPHVTVRNALSVYQLDRVAAKRVADREQVAGLVRELSFTPLGGLVGEPLVNVLELNLELDRRFPVPASGAGRGG